MDKNKGKNKTPQQKKLNFDEWIILIYFFLVTFLYYKKKLKSKINIKYNSQEMKQ